MLVLSRDHTIGGIRECSTTAKPHRHQQLLLPRSTHMWTKYAIYFYCKMCMQYKHIMGSNVTTSDTRIVGKLASLPHSSSYFWFKLFKWLKLLFLNVQVSVKHIKCLTCWGWPFSLMKGRSSTNRDKYRGECGLF